MKSKSKSKKAITAAELTAQLQSDPEYVRRCQERESERKAFREQLAVEEQSLLNDLAEVGVRVASVWDLVNEKNSYVVAIPILARHLTLPYHPKVREGIARALTVREARGCAGRLILDELQSSDEKTHKEVRWALANALTEVADKNMVDEITTLLMDSRYSDVRVPLKLALKKLAGRSELNGN